MIFAALGVLGTLGVIRPTKHSRLRAFECESDDGESGIGLNSVGHSFHASFRCGCRPPVPEAEAGVLSESNLMPTMEAAAPPQEEVSDLEAIVEQGGPSQGRRLRPDELSVIRQGVRTSTKGRVPASGIYSCSSSRAAR